MGTTSGIESAPLAPAAVRPRAAAPEPPPPAARESAQPGLERLVRDAPTSIGFFHAVRLLERLHPDRDPIGGFGDPAQEVVRLRVTPSIAFPPSEIAAIDDRAGRQPTMTVSFMGLNGPQGVLPLVYSAHVAERVRAKDTTTSAFLDLFNHRMISLFYRAWEKSRIAVTHQRGAGDRFGGHLLDLIGLGSPGLRNRLGLSDEALIFYSGLLALQSRSATALEQMVEDYFGVRAEVEQFVGGWYALDEDTQCRLGDEEDASSQLGIGAVAGDEIWDQQARIRLRLGPMSRRQYERFLPTGDAHAPLDELARFFTNDEMDIEVQLILARDEVPGCTLGGDDGGSPPLGWCTWLRSGQCQRDPDDTILTLHMDAGVHT
jgi:type VI secretion system protein ImpH